MERAERLVLLGVGLAFDILVPVLWIMLVLTAFTAVQRFVKVWRQATPGAARGGRATSADAQSTTSRGRERSRSGGPRSGRASSRAATAGSATRRS